MGSVAVVLAMLAAGILVGRAAGPSLAARYLLAFIASVAISAVFLAVVMLGPRFVFQFQPDIFALICQPSPQQFVFL